MLYRIFDTYSKIAFIPAIPLTCLTLIAPIAVALLIGTSERQSASQTERKRYPVALVATLGIAALAAAHIAILLIGSRALVRDTTAPPNAMVELLIGPPQFNRVRLALMGGVVLLSGIASAVGVNTLLTDGGMLREFLAEIRNPPRRRDDLGSATFCLPRDFSRLQRPKPGGLTLLGAFYGKQARGQASERFYRLDAGPNRNNYAGKGLCLSVEDQARGMAIIGPTGTGKSQAGILPVAADTMALGYSVIIVDPQGELTSHLLDYAAVTKHQVIIHDPTDPSMPRYNLAQDIRDVAEAQAITRVLVPDSVQGGEGFWQKSAQNLLAACLLRYTDLGEILLALSDMPALAEKLATPQDGAAYLASSFIASARSDGRVAASTLATLQATALSAWADESVRLATETTDFSASMLVDQPTLLILKCPARYMKVYGPYLGAVLQRMMLDLDTIGSQSPNGALSRPVKIILDEFPMLGRLDAVVEAVNLFRKRRISFMLAAQTISQLELVYGKQSAEALIAGLATQIIFGSCDAATAAYVSRMLGKSTERTFTDKSGSQPILRQRDLMSIEEVITPPKGNCTIIFRYATPTYAAQVVMLANLTYMFQRLDWQQKTRVAQQIGEGAILLEKPPFAARKNNNTASEFNLQRSVFNAEVDY